MVDWSNHKNQKSEIRRSEGRKAEGSDQKSEIRGPLTEIKDEING